MLPPHIIVVEEVLPEVRRKMALSLHAEGMHQGRIAEYLGTSQAMVSRYLREKKEPIEELSRIVENLSEELTVAVLGGYDPQEVTERFCGLMEESISRGLLDDRYRIRFGREPCRSCMGPRNIGIGRSRILQDLTTAARFLVSHPIPDLIPALKVNVAYGQEGAVSIEEIASFPGRLPDRDGRIHEPLSPEFGVSRHLAGALVSAMKNDMNIRAAISLKHDDRIGNTISSMGYDIYILDRSREELSDILEDPRGDEIRLVTDPGDFGIEPCLYIFGRSPLQIVSFAVEVQQKISGGE